MSIRKVQAIPGGLQPVSPFRPGLRLDLSYRDPDEMSARALHWGIEQSQLGRGRFQGATRGIHSSQIQLSCSQRNPGLIIRARPPRRRSSFRVSSANRPPSSSTAGKSPIKS